MKIVAHEFKQIISWVAQVLYSFFLPPITKKSLIAVRHCGLRLIK